MTDADGPRPLLDRRRDRLRLGVDQLRAGELPGPRDGAVLVPCRQHLVPRFELQRADDGVQPRGRVRDENEILRSGADEGRQCGPCVCGEPVEAAPEELDRVALELALQLLVARENGLGAGSVAAVVEEREVRVEQEFQAATVPR